VFTDGAAPTLRVCLAACAAAAADPQRTLHVAERDGRMDLADLLAQLAARGCCRIFVEGGGITVSAFLEAGLLQRLQVAVASLLIGDGRPALRLPGIEPLSNCRRPAARVFRMGPDLLYDCALDAPAPDACAPPAAADLRLQRVI
jgi:diaminohydroxyphosphoribosylaminopyrimidine deaminase / 5-amino-6-(5-phosphoribosylamino)uracil reductase